LIEDRKDLRKIFAGSRPSAIPFVGIGAAALNSLAVPLCALRQLVGTLVDLFAFLRHQVSAPALLPVPSCLQRREVDPPIEVQAAAPSGQPD
jgi:hypothetical protein